MEEYGIIELLRAAGGWETENVFGVGMRRLCWHNFGHNRYVWKSGIMLAF